MNRVVWIAGYLLSLSHCLANQPFDFATKDSGPTEVKILADSLECDQLKNVCTAVGNASAQKLNDPELKTIVAHKLVAYFERNEKESAEEKSSNPQKEKNASPEKTPEKGDAPKSPEKSDDSDLGGHMKLIRLEAEGDVVMTTRENVIQGERAEYRVQDEMVEVFGKHVKITNKENQLNGNHCQANLKTGMYKMMNQGARVQALITKSKKQDKSPS